jgi:hypothetical protein
MLRMHACPDGSADLTCSSDCFGPLSSMWLCSFSCGRVQARSLASVRDRPPTKHGYSPAGSDTSQLGPTSMLASPGPLHVHDSGGATFQASARNSDMSLCHGLVPQRSISPVVGSEHVARLGHGVSHDQTTSVREVHEHCSSVSQLQPARRCQCCLRVSCDTDLFRDLVTDGVMRWHLASGIWHVACGMCNEKLFEVRHLLQVQQKAVAASAPAAQHGHQCVP